MSSFNIFTLALLVLLFNSPLSYSEDPPETSPSPSPDIGADAPSPSPDQGADAPSPSSNNPITPSVSPSPSPSPNSPPAPPPDLAPESSPSSAPAPAPVSNSAEPLKKSPAPSPSEESDISRADSGDIEADDDSSEGMSGSKKAGISIGVVAGACIFGVGSLVYMKRQKNIRRGQYGYVARREIL